MKKLILILSLPFIASLVSAQGIEFHQGDWASAKKKAKQENKAIFVDAYATWCGPCKWMSKNSFPVEKVGTQFNDNYVSIKIDMEKGEGKELAKEWQVRSYPTLLFFDSKGKPTHRSIGALDADGLETLGKSALDPEKQVYTQARKFTDGDREPEFLYGHAMTLNQAGLNATDVTEAYIKTQNDASWISDENWKFIRAMVSSSDHILFKKVVDNRKDFEKVVGENVEIYIAAVLNQDIYTVARLKDVKKLDALKSKLERLVPTEAKALSAKADYVFYQSDANNSHKYAVNYFDNHCDSWNELNSIAWSYFEDTEDKARLKKALSWINKSIDIEENWYNTDTKANLLHKMGRTDDAIKAAEKSIEIGQKAGEDTKETEGLLKNIKEGL